MRKTGQSDLSNAEWGCLESYLPAPRANGRPRIYPLREILDAIFYVLNSGCGWRLFLHDLEHRGRRSRWTDHKRQILLHTP
jgi:putative transposase